MPRRCAPWTREQVVAAIAAFHQRTGRWPVSAQFRAAHGLPSPNATLVHFATLEASRQAAGMPPGALPKPGAAFEAAWANTWPQEER
jgi:hypothetical protein